MRTKTPKKACESIHEAWGPHPGCAEFMDAPETFYCRARATHVVKFTQVYFGEPDPHAGSLNKDKLFSCEFHAKDYRSVSTDQYLRRVQVYRFRP